MAVGIGGNVNGVQVLAPQYALVTFGGTDIGGGGFVLYPSMERYGYNAVHVSNDAGLKNTGIIINNGGHVPDGTGYSGIGPGNYLIVTTRGQTTVKYSQAQIAFAVYVNDLGYLREGGTAYLTNTGTIIGGAQILGAYSSVTNTGLIQSGYFGIGLSVFDGDLRNESNGRIIGDNGQAVGASNENVFNYGLIASTGTLPSAIGGVAALQTSGTVVNAAGATISSQSDIALSLSSGSLANTGLITAGHDYAITTGMATLTNFAGGTISATGTASAIELGSEGPSTVTNAGLITAAGGRYGVSLEGGGFLNNLATGTITAAGYGIAADDFATIKNAGTIMSTGTLGRGVNAAVGLSDGGTVVNQAGALITSADAVGVSLFGGEYADDPLATDALLSNYGTIVSSGTGTGLTDLSDIGAGVAIIGGIVVNAAIGTISGQVFGVYGLGEGNTVRNAGTITGRGGLAGTTLNSVGVGFGTLSVGAVLTNAATGTISGNTGLSFADAGASVVNAGTITASGRQTSGITLAGGGAVTNQVGGTVAASYLLKSYGVAVSGGAGTIVNQGTIFGRTKGLYLGAGGTLTNNGTIGATLGTAGYDGVQVVGTAASTIINAGTIGTLGATAVVNGITAFGGLYLNNKPEGVIAGGYGIRSTSGATTIFNTGTIATSGTIDMSVVNNPGVKSQAIYLAGTSGAAYVSNAAGGTIAGYEGISFKGVEGTVVNAGTIATYKVPFGSLTIDGTYLNLKGASVSFADGGTLINTGTIQSRTAYYQAASMGTNTSSAVITNSGTMSGVFLPSATITNQTGGSIADIDILSGTVTNSGLIFYERFYSALGRPKVGLALGDFFGSSTPSVIVNTSSGTIVASSTSLSSNIDGGRIDHIAAHAVKFVNATLTNAGTILAAGLGVDISGSGTIVNQNLISATGTGIVIGTGTLINSGTLIGVGGSFETRPGDIFDGVTFSSYGGHAAEIGSGVIMNSGLIHGAITVYAGSLFNSAGAIIEGSISSYSTKAGAVTIVNAGTIATDGTQSSSIGLAAGFSNRVVLQAGGALTGIANGGNAPGSAAISTLEFASGTGRLSGFGTTVTNFASVLFDAGAAWTIEGSAAGLAASVFSVDGAGDAIDVDGFAASSHSYLDGTLTLTNVSGGTVALNLVGNFTNASFAVTADGAGGTNVAIACYRRGTRIATAAGERLVEELRIGDDILTHAGATRPIRWIGRRSYSGAFAASNPDVLPILFRTGALGGGLPRRDLEVSPLHAMFVGGALIPARLLVNGQSILQRETVEQVEYFHIELESHDILLAEGAPSESFVDDDSRGMFHNAAEFALLYPDASQTPARFCAPRIEEGAPLAAIQQHLRALASPASEPGALLGFLDGADDGHVRGWAREDGRADTRVRLHVLVDGVVQGEVTADRFRADLAQAEEGDGHCGFEFDLPGGLAPGSRHVIVVKRISDGQTLRNAPMVVDTTQPLALRAGLTPVQPFAGVLDHCERDRIAGWAWQPGYDGPVALQVLDNGVPLVRVLANRHRTDLQAAGIGTGSHGFDILMPAGLSPLARHVVEIRRETDGAALPGTPVVIEPADSFDPALETMVARAVAGLGDAPGQDRVLSFLLAQTERLLQRRAETDSGVAKRHALQQFRRRWGPHAIRPEPEGKRALVIDGRLPEPGRDAGSEAVLSHMRVLGELGYAVSLVAADDLAGDDATLEAACITVLGRPVYASVEDVLRRQAGCFDLVYLHRAPVAARYLQLVRQFLPRAQIVYSMADLHHLRLQRQAAVEDSPELMRASQGMRLLEATAVWGADSVITHSAAEAALLRALVPGAPVHVVPWAVPVAAPRKRPRFADRSGVAFIGSGAHGPNPDAARWLVETVMPLVWQADPAIECLLVGSALARGMQSLARPRVTVLGRVPNLAAVFDRVRLTVAPLRFGAGIKGKVLTSFAGRTPCVMSPIAAEGLALPASLGALIGKDAAALAALIVSLHNDEQRNAAASRAGAAFVRRHYNEATVTEAFEAAITRRTAQAAGQTHDLPQALA